FIQIMKRLLILAYDFPPYVSVGGLRPYAWYRYLKEYGVEPIVVTRQWGNKFGNELDYIAPGESNETIVEATEYGTIIRTPYKPNLANRIMLKYGRSKFALIRKMVTAWYEFMQFLFYVGPKSGLYRGAKEYLKNNKVDAIIATGEPFVLFKYASTLSKKYGVPWVADYRDPWSQNKNRSRFVGKWINSFEKRFTANASVVITVSDFCKVQIETNVHKPFHVIPNGYNPDAIDAVSDIKQEADSLRFAFVGTIYNWHPLESVLQCFSHFADSNINPKFELNFYGVSNADDIVCLLDKYPNLKKHVKVFPRMRNEQLLAELAKHNIMLLLNYYSYMGTKIYDYLGIRRQIMLCYSNDEEANALKAKYYPTDEIKGLSSHLQEDLIAETNSGIIVKNKEELARILPEIYGEFIKTGFVECKSNGFENYSRKGQTKQLAEIIKRL
ncbi:MAG: glycosyltransferase, partial [Bacteroidales bacterium]|nr:glycosyltransferase [Bacteroidales bacterium]